MSPMQSLKVPLALVSVLCAEAVLASAGCTPVSDVRDDDTALSTAAVLAPPTIAFDNPTDPARRKDVLQYGNNNDAYWTQLDNAWGANGVTEGPAPDQYEQNIGVSPTVGSNGEVALRIQWRWPQGYSEVKSFPSVLSGAKPGFYSSDSWVGGHPVRLLDGTLSQRAPTGSTPGTFLPVQLPVPPIKAKFAHSHLAPPTGQGQLTFDLWLQSQPGQDHGWVSSSITHEIMIPLDYWGGYGAYPNGRNPGWYDHDVVINGRLFHVYCTKGQDGQLRYDFGWLDGTYGRSGWKMIVFEPDVVPVPPSEIDLDAFVNHIRTRVDVAGTPWAQGNEYLVSVELGIEPVVGTGDLVIYDYKVSRSTKNPQRVQAETGALSGSGVGVLTDVAGYEGSGFVGRFTADGDRATVSFTNVAAGTYDINIRYHAWGLEQNDVVINNSATTWEASFPGTGSGWGIKTLRGLTLGAGTNTVAIVKGWGYIEADYIEIVPSSPDASDTATKKQLENGSLVGLKITEPAGFEGRGAVGWFANAGDRATVSFTNVAAGTYNIRIRYQSYGNQMNNVIINGNTRSTSFPGTSNNTWAIATISNVTLAAGTNTIAIAKDWGWITADYIEIVRAP